MLSLGEAFPTPGTNDPRGESTVPPFAMEKSEAPEHLQYIDDMILWGKMTQEVFEKGEKIIHIVLKVGFAMKQRKVEGPAQEIQLLGVKWQDRHQHIPEEVINNIATMSPLTSKKKTQVFLGNMDFVGMQIPEYSQIVSPLCLVTQKKIISCGALNNNSILNRLPMQ